MDSVKHWQFPPPTIHHPTHLERLSNPTPNTMSSDVPVSVADSECSDQGQQPLATEFSTLMLLLRAACTLNARHSPSHAEISISNAEPFGVDQLDDPLLAPSEALAGILVQHGEVIAASYTPEAGGVVFTNSDTLTPKPPKPIDVSDVPESDVSDNVIPENFLNTKDASLLSPSFVVTTNSYAQETQGAKDSNPNGIRILEDGTDLWREFKDGPYRWMYAL